MKTCMKFDFDQEKKNELPSMTSRLLGFFYRNFWFDLHLSLLIFKLDQVFGNSGPILIELLSFLISFSPWNWFFFSQLFFHLIIFLIFILIDSNFPIRYELFVIFFIRIITEKLATWRHFFQLPCLYHCLSFFHPFFPSFTLFIGSISIMVFYSSIKKKEKFFPFIFWLIDWLWLCWDTTSDWYTVGRLNISAHQTASLVTV